MTISKRVQAPHSAALVGGARRRRRRRGRDNDNDTDSDDDNGRNVRARLEEERFFDRVQEGALVVDDIDDASEFIRSNDLGVDDVDVDRQVGVRALFPYSHVNYNDNNEPYSVFRNIETSDVYIYFHESRQTDILFEGGYGTNIRTDTVVRPTIGMYQPRHVLEELVEGIDFVVLYGNIVLVPDGNVDLSDASSHGVNNSTQSNTPNDDMDDGDDFFFDDIIDDERDMFLYDHLLNEYEDDDDLFFDLDRENVYRN